MFEHLTIRDQLGYTAFLRLPQSWSTQDKLQEVERVIKMLRLSKVADSPIRLLSGGEKKRVNIGTELLTDPACLLLDEPTSGLDSTSAVALVTLLQQLARSQHKTVITSIHQPSSALFRSFDQLMLLAEGHVVYFGTPQASLEYLRNQKLACPDGYNAADHWMDLLVSDSAIEEEREILLQNDESTLDMDVTDRTTGSIEEKSSAWVGLASKRKSAGRMRRDRIRASNLTSRQQLIDAWDGEAVAEQIESAVQELNSSAEGHTTEAQGKFRKYNTSWVAQYRVLTHRALKNSRSAIFTPLNLTKSAALGVVVGLLWFRTPYTERTVFDRSSYFFFTMTYWVFDSMFQALMAFPAERDVILKVRPRTGANESRSIQTLFVFAANPKLSSFFLKIARSALADRTI